MASRVLSSGPSRDLTRPPEPGRVAAVRRRGLGQSRRSGAPAGPPFYDLVAKIAAAKYGHRWITS